MRRRKETATCATMRALRSLPRTKPSVDWLPPSFKVVMRFFAAGDGGGSAVRTLTKNATANVKTRTATSIWTSRARGGEAGDVGGEKLQAAVGEQKAECAANQSEERAFGEKLAKKADAAGAHGGANAEFAIAADHAGEIEIGNVGAGDEENESRGRQKEQHGGLGFMG